MALIGESKCSEWDHRLHPALADHHELDFSIYKRLFDTILRDERFTEWQLKSNNWQLRFTGNPGCGKTTLSSVVVEELRNSGKNVACLFLQDEVTCEGAFVEDFLHSLFTQFSRNTSLSIEDECSVNYQEYLEACRLQQRGLKRLVLIRTALHAMIPKLQQAFLIVDDIDRCSPATMMFAEEEISYLQRQGIKIMTTSRVSWVDEVPTTCDGKACCTYGTNKQPRRIHLYWECEECRKHPDKMRERTAYCKSCWAEKPGCSRCNNYTGFSQPYEHVDFNISRMNGIKDLVKHAIEQEHGYVGFKGSILEDKLPESAFGKQLLRSGKAGDVAEEITRRADGNIALAHKRLEILHHDQSLKVFYATNDRLPATIVDMFDSGVYSVETQALNERTLGLQALAIVGHNQNGVSFEKFKKLTQLSAKARGIGRKYNPCRSIDDVLHAAKGLVIRETDQDRLLLKAFHSDFFFYCREHYRPSIVWANSLLQETEYDLGPLKRAQTFSPRGIKDSGTNSTSQVKGVANSWKKRKESILPNLPRLEEMEEGDDKVANRSFSFHRSGTFHGL